MNKRHTKPTAQQLANRTYRKLIELEKTFATQIALVRLDIGSLHSGQHMLSERLESIREGSMGTMKTLADHCARLLREKESLMKMHQANEFIAYPAREFEAAAIPGKCVYTTNYADLAGNYYPGVKDCKFKPLHRLGIRCAVCGELELDEASYDAH